MDTDDLRAAMEGVLVQVLRRRTSGHETVSLDLSWAQNGGTSLEAYGAIMQIEQEYGVVVPVRQVLGPRPLGDLLDRFEVVRDSPQQEAMPTDGGSIRATASQRRHWRHAQIEGSAAFLNISHVLACTVHFDASRAQAAFRALVARHEALRTRYVRSPAGELLLEEVDGWPERVAFTCHPEASTEAAADVVIRDVVDRAFALDEEPPVRGGCVPLSDGTGLVYICVHHIAADGWSVDLLARDFLASYNQNAGIMPEATPFSRYAGTLDLRRQAGEYDDDVVYWRNKFAGVSPEFSIADRDGDAVGQPAASLRIAWDGPNEADAIRAVARELGVTTYSLMLASLLAAAHTISGEDDVVVMSGVANRTRAEYRDTVGLFTNQIFFVADFRKSGGVAEYVRRVHEDVVESLGRSELPIEVVLDAMGAYSSRTLAPYANILFQAADAPIEPPSIRDGSWRYHSLGTSTIKRHCNIHLVDTATELALDLDYSVALIGERDATRLLLAIRAGVDHVILTAHSSMADLRKAVCRAAGDTVGGNRPTGGGPDAPVTIFTVDYPGARVEPVFVAFIRETFPNSAIVELPVPRSVGPEEIEECLRRCLDALNRAPGTGVVVTYCSASAWGRHLIRAMSSVAPGSDVRLVCVSGNTVTEQEWVEEFADIARRFDPGADLSVLAPGRVLLPDSGALAERCAAAGSVLATMHSILESATRQRLGSSTGRVVREVIDIQMSWVTYLSTCVVLEHLSGPDSSAPLHLSGNLLEGAQELGDQLKRALAWEVAA